MCGPQDDTTRTPSKYLDLERVKTAANRMNQRLPGFLRLGFSVLLCLMFSQKSCVVFLRAEELKIKAIVFVSPNCPIRLGVIIIHNHLKKMVNIVKLLLIDLLLLIDQYL